MNAGEMQHAFAHLQQSIPKPDNPMEAQALQAGLRIAEGLCINLVRVAEALEKLANK